MQYYAMVVNNVLLSESGHAVHDHIPHLIFFFFSWAKAENYVNHIRYFWMFLEASLSNLRDLNRLKLFVYKNTISDKTLYNVFCEIHGTKIYNGKYP
jgi:hypothetical protein